MTLNVTESNESTDIVLQRVFQNNFYHTRFNSLVKIVTDNRAFRRKKSKQQREVNIDARKETDSDATLLIYAKRVKKKLTKQIVDLSQIYSDLLADENRPSKCIHLLQIVH